MPANWIKPKILNKLKVIHYTSVILIKLYASSTHCNNQISEITDEGLRVNIVTNYD